MSKSKRAIRRHHRERLKQRLYKILKPGDWMWANTGWTHEDTMYHVNRRWNNMQLCSCYSCGNPRRRMEGKETLTMQEVREDEREKCDWEELILDTK